VETIDWASALQDTALIAGVSTAIFFVLDFIKRLYYKLPWGWVQKTPGEVWFALSIALGLAVALLILWPVLTAGEGSLFNKFTAGIYGLVFGAGSKLINSISSSAGLKLKASKEESTARIEAAKNGKNGTATTMTSSTEIPPVQAPVFTEEATPSIEERVEETKQRIKEKVPDVTFMKEVKPDVDYVIINGTVYYNTKGKTDG